MNYPFFNIVITGHEQANLDKCLRNLIAETGANFSLLTDKGGQIISVIGNYQGYDTTALGALLAGDFASATEVARLLKEMHFITSFYLGITSNVYREVINDICILIIIFDKRTHIGVVRALTHLATAEIIEILNRCKVPGSWLVTDIFRHTYDDDNEDDDNAAGSLARVPR